MIKAFLFDYDGVMTAKSGGNSPSELLANLLEMNSDEVGELFMSLWPDYLRGKIDERQLWQLIESRSGKSIPTEHRAIWTKWEQLQPLPEMVAMVKELRATGYPVGLLTNVTPTTEEEVRTHGGYDGFDFLVRSCKVGYAKPDPEIYTLALEQFGNVSPNGVVFIDDRERFLAPARDKGMETILAVGADQVLEDIKRLLAK